MASRPLRRLDSSVTIAPGGSAAAAAKPRVRSEFRAGWMAMLPFWPAVLPGALAYVLAAQAQGFPAPATLLLSMLVFSGSAQIAALGMLAAGAPVLLVLPAIAAMNMHYLALGANIRQHLALPRSLRFLVAFLLIDSAYVLTIARRHATPAFFLGAGASMYAIWVAVTALFVLVGAHPALTAALDLRRLVPLTLAALLTPLVRTRADGAALAAAGGSALLLSGFAPAMLVPLLALLIGCAFAAYWGRSEAGSA